PRHERGGGQVLFCRGPWPDLPERLWLSAPVFLVSAWAAESQMKTLLSDDLWRALSMHAAGHQRIRAAIGYVTAPYLDFRQGDLLICDASDDAIRGGLTSAPLLRSFVVQGAEVCSYDGLHSKVAVI